MRPQSDRGKACAACATDRKKCVTTVHANKSPRTETLDLDDIEDPSEVSEEKSEKTGRRGKCLFVSFSDSTLIGVGLGYEYVGKPRKKAHGSSIAGPSTLQVPSVSSQRQAARREVLIQELEMERARKEFAEERITALERRLAAEDLRKGKKGA